MKDSLLWERLHGGAGKKCEEEGAAKRSCYRLTSTPQFPIHLHCSVGERR